MNLRVGRFELDAFFQHAERRIHVSGIDTGVRVIDEEGHVAGVGRDGFSMPFQRRLEIADEPKNATYEVARGSAAPVGQRRIPEAGVGAPQPAFRCIDPGKVRPCRGMTVVEPDRGFERAQGRCPVGLMQRDPCREKVSARHILRFRQHRAAQLAGKLPVTFRQCIKAGLKPALKRCALGRHSGFSRSCSRSADRRYADGSDLRTSPA